MSPQRRSELASLTVRKLLQTRDGALWVGTTSDLVRYKDYDDMDKKLAARGRDESKDDG